MLLICVLVGIYNDVGKVVEHDFTRKQLIEVKSQIGMKWKEIDKHSLVLFRKKGIGETSSLIWYARRNVV